MNPIIIITLICIFFTNINTAFCDAPFTVTPSDYQHWGLITAKVLNNSSIETGDSNDVLAVFVGDECRGVASPQYPPAGTRFFLQVWSNTTGETLSFKYYDHSTQQVINIKESRVFTNQMVMGSIAEPENFNFVDLKQYGCTDPIAKNYDLFAEADDGSCAYAPVLAYIDNQAIDEDTQLIYTLSASDKNGDFLTFYAKALQSSVPVLVHEQQLEVTPPSNWNGDIHLMVSVSDGTYTDATSFQLTVLPKNDPPLISNIMDQSIHENTSTEKIRFTVTDIDDDDFQISVKSSNTNLLDEKGVQLSFGLTYWELILTPKIQAYGESMITVTVSDGIAQVHETSLLTVYPVSIQPSLSDVPTVIIRENTSSDPVPFTVTDIVYGAENIDLTVTTTASSLVSIEKISIEGSGNNRFLVITPELDQNGSATITLTASNPRYTVNTVFTVIVKPKSEVAIFNRFQKLDALGQPLPDTATDWAMVLDQSTKLIWEVKTNDQGIQGKDRLYTWYNSDSDINGGNAGTATSTGDTQYFIDRLNRNTLGERSDWRIPEISELISLLDISQSNPTIDTRFFPGTQSGCYWSTSPHAQNSGDAWLLNFNDATDDYRIKSTSCYVRAVRGDVPCSLSKNRFVDNLNGTITDTCTGQMWSQNASESKMNHSSAKNYCQNLSLAEYTDWRLPTRQEITTLIDYHKYYPATQTNLIEDYLSDWFWIQDKTFNQKNAWAVYFFYGASYIRGFTKIYYVRPVRAGLQTVTQCFSVGMPMPGTEWFEGDVLSIQWTSCASVSNVNIRLSRSGGRYNTFETLVENYPNNGQFDWTVTAPKTVNALISIEDAADSSVMSNQGLFLIQAQPVPILSVTPLSLTIPAKGGAGKVTITNAGDGILEWKANILDNWISPHSNMSGINDGWFECVAEENSGPARTGCVEISATGASTYTICLHQKANVLVDQLKKVSAGQLTDTFESAWGCNWVDYDNDGWMDIYIVNRYTNDALYHNNKNRTFSRVFGNDLVDDSRDSTAATWADFDNDDDMDVFVVHPNEGNALYINNGNGSFTALLDDITVMDAGISYGASWVDVDNDGNLDLFVTRTGVEGNALYINQGNGHFLKNETASVVSGKGQAVAWGDYLQNGWMDVIIPYSAALYQNTGNLYFHHIDSQDLNLNSSEISFESASWADIDNDGFLDLYLTHQYNNNLLLHNSGLGRFEKITDTPPTLDGGHAADSVWADFDRDGDLDLFVPRLDLSNAFYQNNGNSTFSGIVSGDIITGNGRACAVADYDNDGDLDLLTVQPNEKHLLFENQGSDTHWIGIRCVGTNSNRSAIGATITITAFIYGKNVRQIRQISAQTGHNSQSSTRQVFGLGNHTLIDEIKVSWPGGGISRLNNITADQYITITEDIPMEKYLSVSPAHEIVSALNGSFQISVIAVSDNGAITWTASTENDWLSFIGQNIGINSQNLTVRYNQNPGIQRTGKISIQSEDKSIMPVYVEIIQNTNKAPTWFVPVQELNLIEDQDMIEVNIPITDSDTHISDFEFFVHADNNSLFAAENLSLEAHSISSNTVTLRIEPNLNQFGESFVTISAADGIHRLTDTIHVRVASINDSPWFSGITHPNIEEDQPVYVDFSVGDIEQDNISIQLQTLSPDIFSNESLLIQKIDAGYRLSAQPLPNMFGSAQLKIIASDGPATIETIVNVEILPVNDRPEISSIPDQSLSDTSVSIAFSISDVETQAEDLQVQVISMAPDLIPSDQIQITGTGQNKLMILNSPNNLFGIAPIKVSVSDSYLTQNIEFNVFVRSAGDMPMIANVVDQMISEDETLHLTLTVGGVDSESISVSGSSSNTLLVANSNIIVEGMGEKRYLKIIPTPDFYGQTQIKLQVTDGTQTVLEDFFLIVQAVNDPPVISSIYDIIISEDSPMKDIVFTAYDIDSENLSVRIVSSDTSIISQESIKLKHTDEYWVLTPNPLPNAFGTCTISVQVSDGPLTTIETFKVEIRPVNDSPIITSIADQTINEDTICTIQLELSDEETPITSLGISIQSDNPFLLVPDGMSIGNSFPLTISLSPLANAFGKANVIVTIDDGSGMPNSKAQETFVLWVNPINDTPEISTITEKSIPENFSLTFVFSISDVETSVDQLITRAMSDNQTLLPDKNLQIIGDGQLRILKISPRPNFSGETTVSISAFDGGQTGIQSFNVKVTPQNQPPSFVIGMDQYIWEDAPPQKIPGWATQISAGPLNELNQELTFKVIGNTHPEFFTATPVVTASGSLHYTLAANAYGMAEITLVLLDNGETNNSSTPQSFLVNISSVNDPPTFSKGPDIVIKEDAELQRYEYWAKFIQPGPSNESNQQLTFKLRTYSSSLFELLPTVSNTGTLIFKPAANAYGIARFWIYLEDDGDGFHTSESESFNITIIAENDPPTIEPVDNVSMFEDHSLDIELTIKDVDTHISYLSLDAQASNPTLFQKETLKFTGTNYQRQLNVQPSTDESGVSAITVTIYDGMDSWSTSFTVTVIPVNDPPEFASVPHQYMTEDAPAMGIPLNLYDAETPVEQLVITAKTQNPDLFPQYTDNIWTEFNGTEHMLWLKPSPNGWGTGSITLSAHDPGDLSAITSLTIWVTVQAIDDPPELKIEPLLEMFEDKPTSFAINVLDIDTDLNQIYVSALSENDNIVPNDASYLNIIGSTSLRTLNISPAAHANGELDLTLTVRDAVNTVSETVHLIVQSINDPPVANNFELNVIEDEPRFSTFQVTDMDDDPLTYSIITQGHLGILTLTQENYFVYTPFEHQYGLDKVTYMASDGKLISGLGTIDIIIAPVNDVPQIKDLFVTVMEDSMMNDHLYAFDPDNDLPVFSIIHPPQKGQVMITDDRSGAYFYRTNENAYGQDSFTYKVNDGTIDSPLATVFIEITPVNDLPNVKSQKIFVDEDSWISGIVTGTDLDDDPLTFEVVLHQGTATFVMTSDGQYFYTPIENYNGTDVVSYIAFDGQSNSNFGQIVITVLPVNDPPVAKDGHLSVKEDLSNEMYLEATDIDLDPLSYTAVALPQHGSLYITSKGIATYTPTQNFSGTDQFSFVAGDRTAQSEVAWVTINIIEVNDKPVSSSDQFSVLEDQSVSGQVYASDEENDILTYNISHSPENGRLNIFSNKSGHFTYMPEPDFVGNDQFCFTADDGFIKSDQSCIEIVISPVNDSPISQPGTYTLKENEVLNDNLNAFDIDQDTLNFKILVNGIKGTAQITNEQSGEFIYTPDNNANGIDSIIFQVSDGLVNSTPSQVTLVIQTINDAPLVYDAMFTTPEDKDLIGQLNATDVDGDTLTFHIVQQGNYGKASISNPKTGSFMYFPNPNYFGMDQFTFQATDPSGAVSNISRILISIQAINDPPIAVSDSLIINEDQVVTNKLRATDIDADVLTFIIDQDGFKGHVEILDVATGTYIYTPLPDATGMDSFIFSVFDGKDRSEPAMIQIEIVDVNDRPEAFNTSISIMEDQPVQDFLKANDPDNDALVFVISRIPYKGEVKLLDAGKFSYTPNSNENGSDTFTFTVNDGRKTSIPATVTLTIYPVNDPPFAKAAVYFPIVNQSLTQALPIFDPDFQDSHSIHLIDFPKKGQINLYKDQFSYLPVETGIDYFTYQVNDGYLNSNIGRVIILTGIYGQEFQINPDKNNDGEIDLKDLIMGLEQLVNIGQPGNMPVLEDIIFVLRFVGGMGGDGVKP